MPAADAGTPTRERATSNRGVASRPDGPASAKPALPRALPRVGTLMIVDKGFGRIKANLYNEAHFGGKATLKEVDSWAEMKTALTSFQSIDRLVFLIHSNPGTFLFKPDRTETRFREKKDLTEAATELSALQARPIVGTVDLAGCNVGFRPDTVVQFGLALGAKEAIATNHFHEFALDHLTAKIGQNAPLDKHLLGIRGYVSTPGTDALVKQAQTKPVDKTVLLEWFVATDEEHQRDLPVGSNIDANQRAKTFKPAGAAYNVTVDSPDSLKALSKDISQFQGQEPFRQLIRMSFRLDGFRPAADAGQPSDAGERGIRPDAGRDSVDGGRPIQPEQQRPVRPDGGRPERPPQGQPRAPSRRQRDAGRFALSGPDRSRRLTSAIAGQVPEVKLSNLDQAIVDEVFRRGGLVGDAMGVLYMRVLTPPDYGRGQSALPPARLGPPRNPALPRFTLENWGLDDRYDMTPSEQQKADAVAALRPAVVARYDAYVALTKKEFGSLRPEVAISFTPLKDTDSYLTAEEKYVAMRSVYYRAGYTCMKRDVFDQIEPATFFGAPVIGGVHRELKALLARVEQDVRANYQGVANRSTAVGFAIGGFVPRAIAGSNELSQHAFGMAIDVDPTWNPQLKKPGVIAALQQATKEDVGKLVYAASSMRQVDATYARVEAISNKLKAWLQEWLPKYDQLQEDRKAAVARKDDNRVGQLDEELKRNPDLAALNTLIKEYSRKTVDAWRVYGIITIPKEVVSSFVRLGQQNRARWGGAYDNTKDNMHLELMQFSALSGARPGGPGRRNPVQGFDDLLRTGDAPRAPDCGVLPPAKIPGPALR